VKGDSRLFPPFRLDASNAQLWRGAEQVHLRPKTFDVLRKLVENPGQLLTKAALLDAVWPRVSVSDSMPTISVRELRTALGDNAQTPRFIETVHGRGYRFIAEVTLEPAHGSISAPSAQTLSSARRQPSFVGRKREWAELSDALADAASGHGRLCLISGEPGIGKTRICAELAIEARAKGLAGVVGHCTEQEAVPYLPFVEILETWVDRAPDRDALRKLLGEEGPELGRMLPRLKRALPDLPPPLELSPLQARRILFNCFRDLAARIAREQPTLLVLEDLHWAEESTLSLLAHLTPHLSDLPLLVLCTYRDMESEVTHALAKTLEESVRGRRDSTIRLTALRREEVAQLLNALSGKEAPVSVVNEIYRETAGNPFFVEELFRYLSEENRLYDAHQDFRTDLEIDELNVPRSVRLVIGRRLQRLNPVTQKILQAAATIGKSFPLDLLEAVTALAPGLLLDCLDHAEHAALVASSASEARFEFCHEMSRQVVISGLSGARRRRLHLEVANAIERLYPEAGKEHYYELAQHFSHTNDSAKAAHYLGLAAVQASQRSAFAQAAELARRGISILAGVGESAERDRKELGLQNLLGQMLATSFSPGSVEVERVLTRTIELSRQLGDETQLFLAVISLPLHFQVRAEGHRAREAGEQALELAVRLGRPWMLGIADALQAASLLWFGQPDAARAHCEQSLAALGPGDRAASQFPHFTTIFPSLSRSLWLLGFPDRARRVADEAISKARALKNTLAVMVSLTAWDLNRFLRDLDRTREHAEAAIALGSEYRIRPLELVAIGQRAWGLVQENPANAEMADVRSLMEGRWVENREKLGIGSCPSVFAMQVEAHLKMKQPLRGLKVLEQAFSRVEPTGERMYEAELFRLKGELLLAQDASNAAQAEESFRTAVEIARKQLAKSWELRATTSLARLLDAQCNRKEARAVLADIHSWFTEGFDTADLRDAKALLDELSG
jgi:DNA-binding winged helix-turn-helix (wHTH) protein/tetratricopeptide (TPR) repeat protein